MNFRSGTIQTMKIYPNPEVGEPLCFYVQGGHSGEEDLPVKPRRGRSRGYHPFVRYAILVPS